MSAQYTPPAGTVVHEASASLDSRDTIPGIVHLVQYDYTVPVIAVHLTTNSQPYAVPAGASASIRLRKPDGKNVYNPALGLSEDRTVAYIAVTRQMTVAAGRAAATVELANAEGIVGTAQMVFEIDRNPIQEADLVSSDEYKTVFELAAEVEAAAGTVLDNLDMLNNVSEHMEDIQAARTSAAEADKSAKAADKSRGEAENWSNTSKSWAIGEGMGDKRPDEGAVNAKEFARQAKISEENAAGSVQVITDNREALQAVKDNLTAIQNVDANMEDVKTLNEQREAVQAVSENVDVVNTVADNITAVQNVNTNMTTVKGVNDNMASVKTVAGANTNIQTVVTNLQAIKDAPDAALRAEAAADAAELSAEMADEAASRAQSIAQGAKGYYENPENLRSSVPEGTLGDWAIVGSTDTIWVWDDVTAGWKDSHQATDLSNYYTKNQADAENNKLLSQITQETDTKLANKLGKTEKAVSATNVETISNGPNLTVREDTNNVWLQVGKVSGSEVLDKFDIVIDKKDGHVWIHEYKNDDAASGGLGNHTIYTSAFPQPSVTGNAGTATRLAAPRNISISGGATAAAKAFDGTAAIDLEVTALDVSKATAGTLAVARGGTGQTTTSGIRNAIGLGTETGALTVAHGGTGATAAAQALTNLGGQPKHATITVALAVASWSESNTITVNAAGVTASNTVIVSPAPASWKAWCEAGVRCTAQAAGKLTFTAESKPTAALTAQVMILN